MATAKRAVAKKSAKTTVIQTQHDRIDWRSLYLVCRLLLVKENEAEPEDDGSTTPDSDDGTSDPLLHAA